MGFRFLRSILWLSKKGTGTSRLHDKQWQHSRIARSQSPCSTFRYKALTQLAAPRGSVPILLTGHRKMGTDPCG